MFYRDSICLHSVCACVWSVGLRGRLYCYFCAFALQESGREEISKEHFHYCKKYCCFIANFPWAHLTSVMTKGFRWVLALLLCASLD